MAKDPAFLFYPDKWIASTNGMSAIFRAWYFDLLVYQYDRGNIPSDTDELAGICRVRPSEYDIFKQMIKQVLQQKFKLSECGTYYTNEIASETMKKREAFIDKRTKSGLIGQAVKQLKTLSNDNKLINLVKVDLYAMETDEIKECLDKQVLKQMLKQKTKLYINVNVNEDVIKDLDIVKVKNELQYPFSSSEFMAVWNTLVKQPKWKKKSTDSLQASLKQLSRLTEPEAIETMERSIAGGWQGLFPNKETQAKVAKKENVIDQMKRFQEKGLL